MTHTYNDVLRSVSLNVLNSITPGSPIDPDDIEERILSAIATTFRMENAMREKGEKWKIPLKLPPYVIALVVRYLYRVVKISTSSNASQGVTDYDTLAIYMDAGPNAGIYVADEVILRNVIRRYNSSISSGEIEEAIAILSDTVPAVSRCNEKNLIAVNNGIFDYSTKQLLPFTPDKVFTAKSKVDYNPNAVNPVITEPDGSQWDVESWMDDLSNDPEIVNLLWHILGAIIRPNVSWNKCAWFYSESGNNGKGTLCELMRQLCGEGTYTSISLADMGKDFLLEPLVGASAVIVDENDVGTYVDKAANLKAIVTGDVILINRKYKRPITIQPRIFMVQCLNEMPRVKDRSDSFYRRQLFVPFEKCFTGREKKYIKNEFLHRRDVLEYVLKKVLTDLPDYYELPEPDTCKLALDEYKEFNDPVRGFLTEILPELKWDLVPWSFLYDAYKGWVKETNPSGSAQGRNSFIKDVIIMMPSFSDSGFIALNPKHEKRATLNRMVEPEPLIDRFNLTEWMNPFHNNKASLNQTARCTFPLTRQAEKYSGLFRTK